MSITRIIVRIVLVLGVLAAAWAAWAFYRANDPDYYWQNAEAASKAGDFPTAKIYLQKLLQKFPHHVDGHYTMAQFLLAENRGRGVGETYASNPQALHHLAEAARLAPKSAKPQKSLLTAYLEMARTDDAAKVAARLAAIDPNDPDALLAQCYQALDAKNEERAAEFLAKLSQRPDRPVFQTASLAARLAGDDVQNEAARTALTAAVAVAASAKPEELAKLPPLERRAMERTLLLAVRAAADRREALERVAVALSVAEKLGGDSGNAAGATANNLATPGARATFAAQAVAVLLHHFPPAAGPASDPKESENWQRLVSQFDGLRKAAVASGQATPLIYSQAALLAEVGGDKDKALALLDEAINTSDKLVESDADKLSRLHLQAARILSAKLDFAGLEKHIPGLLAGKDTVGWGHLYAGGKATTDGKHDEALRHYLAASQQLGNVLVVQIALGNTYLQLGRPADATPHLEGALAALEPSTPEMQAWVDLHRAHRDELAWSAYRARLAQGQWDEAQPHLAILQDTALAARAASLAALYSAAKNEPDRALSITREARARHPNDLRLRRLEALILRKFGRPAEATALIEELATSAPDDLMSQLLLADWLASTKERERAIALLTDLESRFAESPLPGVARAVLLLSSEDEATRKSGLELLDQLQTRFADNQAVQALRARALLLQGETDQALALAQQLASHEQLAPLAHLIEANVAWSKGEYDKAAAELDAMAKDQPAGGALQLARGRAELAAGHYREAVELLSQALSVTRVAEQARGELLRATLLLAEKEGPAEAAKAIAAARATHPQDTLLLLIDADLRFKQGQFAEGMALLGEAQRAAPDSPVAAYVEAGIWRQVNQPQKSLEAAERSLQLAPDHLPSLALVAMAQLSLGAFDKALAAAEKVLARDPKNWPLQLVKADALVGLDRRDEAAGVLQAVIAGAPQDARAYRGLAGLKLAEQKADEALAICRQGRAAVPTADELVADEVGLLCQAGRLDEARAAADAAAAQAATAARALALATTFKDARQWSDARRWAEQASKLEADPLLVRAARLALAEVDVSDHLAAANPERLEEARRLYEAAVQEQPDDLVAATNLAWLHLQCRQDPQAAWEVANRVRGDRKLAELPLSLIKILVDAQLAVGDREQSMSLLNEALAVKADEGQWYLELGKLLIAAGRAPEGNQALAKAIELGVPQSVIQQHLQPAETAQP